MTQHTELEGIVLDDGVLRVELTATGTISRLNSKGRILDITQDDWEIDVDGRTYSSGSTRPVATRRTEREPEVTFDLLADDGVDVSVRYALRANGDLHFVDREVAASPSRASIWVDTVRFRTEPSWAVQGAHEVRTFFEAPFAAVQRSDGWSLLSGVENPHAEAMAGDSLDFAYHPALQVAAGETFRSSRQFLALVEQSGQLIREVIPRTRVSADEPRNRGRFRNPTGDYPLDWAEVRGFQSVVRDFLAPVDPRLRFTLYTFWTPLPQLPAAGAEADVWRRTIDNFADLGGELLLTVPLVHAVTPALDPDSFWDLEPEGSVAAELMGYARAKGLAVGYYMGVAGGNLPYGNVPGLGLPMDGPDEWRKVNADGSLAQENCLACADYRAWWSRVQANTIRRFGLEAWSWDPGPGNGRFCHATHHGHRPGRGAHKGWLEGQRLVEDLRSEFPSLHLQGFYGQKEDGTWGLRGVTEHEGYWEQEPECGSAVFPDLSAERLNGSGVRQQAWWSQNFRFLPAETNHALFGRMSQICLESPDLLEVFDHWGWRYGLLSALAVGGTPEASTLPPPDAEPAVRDEYRRWIEWAKATSSSLANDVAGGAQVELGGVDWHYRWDDEHRWLIIGNPGPRPAVTTLDLPDSLYAGTATTLQLRTRWPEPGGVHVLADGGTSFGSGRPPRIEVPALTVAVYEIEEFEAGADVAGPRPAVELSVPVPLDTWSDATEDAGGPGPLLPGKIRTRVSIGARLDQVRRRMGAQDPEVVRARHPFSPDTFAYADPARITLIVPLRRPEASDQLGLTVDGEEFPIQLYGFTSEQRMRPFLDTRPEIAALWSDFGVVWWADISSAFADRADVDIRLSLPGVSTGDFLGPWLQVPAELASLVTSEPADGVALAWGGTAEPVAAGPTDTEGPRVCSAWLDPRDLADDTPFTVSARTESDDVDEVFVSLHVGEGNLFDRRLTRDESDPRLWSVSSHVFDRAGVIMDAGHFVVRAVSPEGVSGPDARIDLTWRLRSR